MARNLNDLADFLYSDRRAEVNSNFDSGHTTTIYGTAAGDSSDGTVMVVLSDDVTQPDGMEQDFGTTVEVPTTTSVQDGDEVIVTLVGGDMKTPIVSGVVGAGDRVMEIASEAKAVAEATGQYFWHDDGGAHISTEAEEPLGTFNSLWNSLGLIFRSVQNTLVSITQSAIAFFDGNGNSDANIVASFGSAGAIIGKAASKHIEIDSDSVDFLDGTTAIATMENGTTAAGLNVYNSGWVKGGKSESALWMHGSNSIGIGTAGSRPSQEQLQIGSNGIYMRSGYSPSAVSFELGGTKATSGNVTVSGYIKPSEFQQANGTVSLDSASQEAWLDALGFEFGTYSGTVNVTTNWNGMYFGTVNIFITERANTSYHVLTTLRCAGNLVWCSLNTKRTSSFEVFVISPRNNAQAVEIDWMVFG